MIEFQLSISLFSEVGGRKAKHLGHRVAVVLSRVIEEILERADPKWFGFRKLHRLRSRGPTGEVYRSTRPRSIRRAKAGQREITMKLFLIGGPSLTEQEPHFLDQLKLVRESMRRLGNDVIRANHDLLVCSPFADSADVEAVRGAAEALDKESPCIEFHYPGAPNVAQELDRLLASLPRMCVQLFMYHPPIEAGSREAWTHAWLLA